MIRKSFFILAIAFAVSVPVWSQSSMSDQQVLDYVELSLSQGKNQKQIAMELARRGVTEAQGQRVKKLYEQRMDSKNSMNSENLDAAAPRLNRMRTNGISDEVETVDQNFTVDGEEVLTPTASVSSYHVYGREIFNTRNLSFEPSRNLPTPPNYRLGPGDEVIIDIWGNNQATLRDYISPDGSISISDIGLMYLNGMTVTEATTYLKKELNKIYAGIDGDNPTSEIKVTLGATRTIQVNVMGEVLRPGTYSLSSFATVFHALYIAGGVSDIGSLRSINVVRNGRKIAEVDVYDFIMRGDISDDIRLQEGDVIMVPAFETLVKIEGRVKRSMRYELKAGETISTLLKYCGGFTSDAYTRIMRVVRQNGKEMEVCTVDEFDYGSFKLRDGDALSCEAILDRFENRLEIKGAVYRPGVYQLDNNVNTVRTLLEKADGLLGDAFTSRAQLMRERDDLTREILSVDLQGILDGRAVDVPLRRNDVLFIPSKFDLMDFGSVSVDGEVMRPGELAYADNMTLEDAIIQCGGLLESASTVRVDVTRRIKDTKAVTSSDEIAKTFTFALKDGFVLDGEPGFVLQPYDYIHVRRSPNYHAQKTVSVTGEVVFDGSYAMVKKSERISDLVQRAGGLTTFAHVRGARLVRRINSSERKRMEDVLELARYNSNGRDSMDVSQLDLGDVYYVGINLDKALAHPGSSADVILREGDVLEIPQQNNTVRISGSVLYNNTVAYEEGAKVKYYIEQAGGYAARSKKKHTYIIYANGTVHRAKKNTVVEPGCEIVVPQKSQSSWSLKDTLAIATTSASLATMIASIANLLN